MRPIHRWLLGAAAALLLLPLLAALCLRFFIDPNRFRGLIEQAAQQRLGIPLQLQGDLRWSAWPLLAIDSQSGRIADPASAEAAPLLQWQRLQFGVPWRGLWSQRFVLDSLSVEGLQLRLERDASGRGNWQALLEQVAAHTGGRDSSRGAGEGNATADAGAAGAASAGPLQLRSLRLRDARLDYRDAAKESQWRIGPLQFEGALDYAAATGALRLEDPRLEAVVAGGSLPEAGIPLRFDTDRLAYDTRSTNLRLAPWQLRIAELAIESERGESLQLTPLRGAGTLKLRTASIRALLTTLGITPPPTRDDDALGRLELETGWQADGARLDLQPLRIHADDTQIEGQAMWPLDDSGPALLELRADHADFDRYRRPEDQPGEPFELPVEKLRAIDLEGTVSFDTAELFGVTLRGARFRLHSDRGLATASRQ